METDKAQGVQKRRRGLETARQILDAAAELFAQNGYDGVSMRAIARKVGVRESALYNHFQSKAELLEALFDEFIRLAPQTRPSDQEIDQMLAIMEPEEVFKAILFHVGKHVGGTLANTAMIIHFEKYRNPRAVEMYYRYVVSEPVAYYERLIQKMEDRKMIKAVDSRAFAEQYNYVSMGLTKEYIMAQYGLADSRAVVGTMIRTLKFFCGLMKREPEDRHEDKTPRPIPEGEVPPV